MGNGEIIQTEGTMTTSCVGYPFHLHAFLADTGLGGHPTVIVVQPVQHRERHDLPCLSLSRR
jgi:hypothetical protein